MINSKRQVRENLVAWYKWRFTFFAVNMALKYSNIVLCCVSKMERLLKQSHVPVF